MQKIPDANHEEIDALAPHMERLYDHLLPDMYTEDMSTLVLKGHLVVELAMDELLASILTITKLPEDNRLEFDQKLSLVRSFVCSRNFPVNSDILASIKQLNELRNKVGHILIESDDLSQRVGSLVREHYKRIGKKSKAKDKFGGFFLIVIRDILNFLIKSKLASNAERAK